VTGPPPPESCPLLAVIRQGGHALPPEAYGGKAVNLARMASLGIPVPPAFVLHIRLCQEYFASGGRLPASLPGLLRQGIAHLEQQASRGFGSVRRPLLLSVRSGAAVSMPGMMETVLNVGLNTDTLRGLIAMTGNPRFAWNTYHRFIVQFAHVVSGHDPVSYRRLLEDLPGRAGQLGREYLDFMALKQVTGDCLALYAAVEGTPFPSEPSRQLEMAVEAVFRSWESPRALAFRRMQPVPVVPGTAVTIQVMMFGNLGLRSGAGVAFTRDPSTGDDRFLIDFLPGGQGEDVVAGDHRMESTRSLEVLMPEVSAGLLKAGKMLERGYHDMQDIEFTVEEGRLFFLQCRPGRRSPLAALRIAVDLVKEGILSPHEALDLLAGVDVEGIRIVEIRSPGTAIARGVGASPGVATGRIALNPERVGALTGRGDVILVRDQISPDDLPAIAESSGILSARGSRTSHAAVVARELGKVCIVSCPGLRIDEEGRRCWIGDRAFREGEIVSLDGSSGDIYAGPIQVVSHRPEDLLEAYRAWKGGSGAGS